MEVQVFDLFIEQAESEELKELIKGVKEMYIEKERLKNDIKRITEITNQKIKIINDVREYIKSRQNTLNEIRISRILEMLEGEKE